MTRAELSESIRQFSMKWANKGKEDEDDRSFWIDLFQRVLDVENATDLLEFQKKVVVNSTTKKIDVYIPDTKVIIEQKSNNKSLDEKILQGDGEKLTPFEQAERYNNHLPHSEKARWIVTSNFKEIWIYDMDKNDREREPIKIELNALGDKHSLLKFLIKEEVKEITDEVAVSVKAGDIVGLIYDAFLEEYGDNPTEEDLKELNKLCVRLVFCLYAEDAGLFEDNAFHDYLQTWNVENMNSALEKLFDVLDTPLEKRRSFLDDRLKAFPYVNGELFKDKVEIPPITEKIKKLLLDDASRDFDWSKISPTIFGAVFESTLNPETRRSGGMHYTSVENIHKVIDPLFMDELEKEFENIEGLKVPKTKLAKLKAFQDKLASLKFLDPACGSGNFLTETYISIRRLENRVLQAITNADKKQTDGQMGFGNIFEGINPIKVSIGQFYGIEINDFAVTVAKTALWIAENQMMQETSDLLLMDLDFLPLKSYTNIVEGNALRLDWNDVIPSYECNYIMGNPPFIGASNMTKEQKQEMFDVFNNMKKTGDLDYVTAWYKKSCEYVIGHHIKFAFVSTNSICQGEHVILFWKHLQEKYNANIVFAYQTFIWNSEATDMAHVHCVIVGVDLYPVKQAKLFDENGRSVKICKNINGYLVDAENLYIQKFSKPLCNVPKMIRGSSPCDNGNFSFTEEEKEKFVKENPSIAKYIKKYIGAREFINKIPRYCLWLYDASPEEIKGNTTIKKIAENVTAFRLSSKKPQTRELAKTPLLWEANRYNGTDFILIPRVSSQNRHYIPMGFMDKDTIANDATQLVPNANIYQFGILTSIVHMAWMRIIAGRLKSDFRYSNLVYNSFPWPTPTEEQKLKIEKTAQDILDARALYPNSSLADLYDPLTMPKTLREAHRKNDIAVMQAYGFDIKTTTAEKCVAELMKLYQKMTDND